MRRGSGIKALPTPEAVRRFVLEALDQGQGRNVKDSDVVQGTGLPLQAVRDHLDLLGDADMMVLARDLEGGLPHEW